MYGTMFAFIKGYCPWAGGPTLAPSMVETDFHGQDIGLTVKMIRAQRAAGDLFNTLVGSMSNADLETLVSQQMSNRGRNPDLMRNILGVDVSVLSRNAALAHMARLIASRTHTKFSFLNAHAANIASHDNEFSSALEQFEVLADGVGVDLCSFINYGEYFPDNLNGTDFVPKLLSHLQEPVSVALLGSEPGVADLAAKRMQQRFPRHRFDVVSHGYYPKSDEPDVLWRLKDIRPDILLVALGNPAQEKWIASHCNQENCTLAFAVGAYLDFVAGRVPRAPALLRRLRLEWLFRLVLEPRRMWIRYVLGNPLFLARSIMQKLKNGWYGTN